MQEVATSARRTVSGGPGSGGDRQHVADAVSHRTIKGSARSQPAADVRLAEQIMNWWVYGGSRAFPRWIGQSAVSRCWPGDPCARARAGFALRDTGALDDRRRGRGAGSRRPAANPTEGRGRSYGLNGSELLTSRVWPSSTRARGTEIAAEDIPTMTGCAVLRNRDSRTRSAASRDLVRCMRESLRRSNHDVEQVRSTGVNVSRVPPPRRAHTSVA